jgi:hypothetical protein
VRGGVVQDQVHVQISGDFLLQGVEELLELDRAVAECSRTITLPVVMSRAA